MRMGLSSIAPSRWTTRARAEGERKMRRIYHNEARHHRLYGFRSWDPDIEDIEADLGRRFDRDAGRPTKTGGGRR